MPKVLLVIVFIMAVTAGYSSWQEKENGDSLGGNGKNISLMNGNGTLDIVTQEMPYFEGAKGYFVRPKEGAYPGVVMIHENRGLRPEIKEAAEKLAREGYLVLAVDLYQGRVVETQDEARAISGSFDQAKGTENLKAAASFLRERGATKMASLGWCFGGRQSLVLATSGVPLDATVVYDWWGNATTTEALAPIKWPVLGVFGDKDQAIPVEKVREFEASLKTLNVPNEIYIYPGVGHAFANPSGANYAPNETKDAWEKTVTFLEKHLRDE